MIEQPAGVARRPEAALGACVSRAETRPLRRSSTGPWLWMSVAGALLAAGGSAVGLLDVDAIYGRETPAFVDQAVAQDIVNLTVVSPAIIVLALLAHRGSLTAHLGWLGTLAFTVYNYVIYTVSVHVGPLFLLWIAVLGLASYAMAGGFAVLGAEAVKARFAHEPRRLAGWYLIIVATMFGALWISQIVPAILAGDVPSGAGDLNLPSSPVHVLDLSLYLPATIAAGVLLLRRRAWGYITAPALLIFLGITGLPILVTPLVADAPTSAPPWAVLTPIAAVTVTSFALAARLLYAATRRTSS